LLAQLQGRVKELEDRLATTSRASHKPPSSEGFVKQRRSLREPSTRKPGGQPGHRGATLEAVAEPEQTLLHEPRQCTACGGVLGEVAGRLGEERRQVFALPPLKLEVTEHRVVIKECPVCGSQTSGVFPEEGPAGVKSLLTSLNQEHLVPCARSCQICADLFGRPVSEGTLATAVNACAEALTETETRLKQGVSGAPIAHFDETGMKVEGKRGWLHTASTPQLTHYAYHAKGGSTATEDIGILPEFGGRAIHDAFSAYWR
jgi:transposase